MRKTVLFIALIVFSLQVSAQQKGKIRVGFDGGFDFPGAGIGFGGDLDVRYNITDNINAGILLASVGSVKDMIFDQGALSNATQVSTSSYLAHGDYYFSKGKSIFSPFVGAGLGIYKTLNVNEYATNGTISVTTSDYNPSTTFGGLIRGGFELWHFRMALSYYLIPHTTLYDVNNNKIGTTGNSYLSFTAGFYFGGGKWKK